ncbi:MAG: hypothetical protein HS126_21875 [Anaerolineales bacterium]|nr:hypothetical protein [Anaerolineales bacterium]
MTNSANFRAQWSKVRHPSSSQTRWASSVRKPWFTQVGYTWAEVIGQNPNLLKSGYTPPEEYQRLWDTITWAASGGASFRTGKERRPLLEAATISPILNERGEITHFLAVKEDITAQAQNRGAAKLEEQLRQAHKMESVAASWPASLTILITCSR